eukprot:CAMPEP_0194067038 /NCGR_PEP_ID=MMETSP0009_2-20130614/86349_1 /TAXON_ID=210454 /ORGANISM="Grammatophora oceanica, Strain CCMP 410" /LENGTH=105 /DNA_ID=CAMNT_0038720039 /DNA_START=320 /DNA_END=636 /DNA_ORIENTATION=+
MSEEELAPDQDAAGAELEAPTVLQTICQRMMMVETDVDGSPTLHQDAAGTELEAAYGTANDLSEPNPKRMVMVETDVDDGSPTLPKTWKASGLYRWTVIAQTKRA